MKYGYSKEGKSYHSFLDYPNEISSSEAIKLSDYMASLQHQWENDVSIYYPCDKQFNNELYWEKEFDLKDPVEKQTVLQSIAKDLGIVSHHPPQMPPPDLIARKIRGGPPKKHRAIPNNMDYLSPQNNHQYQNQKLQYKTSKIIAFHPVEFPRVSVQLDGVFDNSGTVQFRKSHENEHIVFNLTLYGQSDNVLSHVSLSETNEATRKVIHINNRHPSTLTTCLTYHMEIAFPAKMCKYKELDMKINHAQTIQGDLNGIQFDTFTIGLGKGALILDSIEADHILLGNLNGMIRGTFMPHETMGAATLKGATHVVVSPQTRSTKSTIVTLNGPVKAFMTKPGGFTVHCWLCEPSVLSETLGIHMFTRRRPGLKSGYSINSSHDIRVHSIRGESKLIYT